MTAPAPDDLVTLETAAKWVPKADAEALKRLARRGKLTVYRPGKAYLTTRADVQRMIEACRVAPKARDSGFDRRETIAPAPGLSSTEHVSAALDSALAQLPPKKTRR